MSGRSSDKFNSWRKKLLKILSLIEAKNDKEFIHLKNYLKKFYYIQVSVWASTPVFHFIYNPRFKLKFLRQIN